MGQDQELSKNKRVFESIEAKKVFQKGMKYLAIALPLLFLSPVIVTIGFKAINIPDTSGIWPSIATSAANSANTIPSRKRSMADVVKTEAQRKPSNRAISHDRTSGLMPKGMRIATP